MSLAGALTSAVLPVLSVAAVGYVLARVRDVAVDPLATITLYVLLPALVFYTLATTEVRVGTAVALVAGVAAFTVAMVALAEVGGRLLGETEPLLGAFVLASVFPNAGNLGIPLSSFAFGTVGREVAVLYIVGQTVLMYTLGVYVASRGTVGSTRAAVANVFRLPLVYAVGAAGIARVADLVPATGTAAMETVRLTGEAAIPVMLLLLGVQLANARPGTAVRRVAPAAGMKLLVAPAVGLGVALSLGLDGDVGRVFVLECAMPAAVTPLLFAIQYGSDREGLTAADYVGSAVLVTTVLSVVTLVAVIALLGG